MAECHPVGFQWVEEARARGATVIHVDPRFTRTSAVCDKHIPIRAGSDVVLLGALVNHVISNDLWFHDYVVAYTNAATLINDDFRDTEDLGGLFSGYDPETGHYDLSTWAYAEDDGGRRRQASTASTARAPPRAPPATSTAAAARLCRTLACGATTHCRTRTRCSRSSSATMPATPRSWSATSAASRSRFRLPCPHHRRELGTRTHHLLRLRGRLDAAHAGCPVHPHRNDSAAAAGQRRTPGQRHHGAARTRQHPGLHRHPDPVQPAARLPADAEGRRSRHPRTITSTS